VSGRRITTTVTLTVLFLVLAGMAVYGFKAATAPLPGGEATAKNPCSKDEKQVKKFLKRGDVVAMEVDGIGRLTNPVR